MHQAFGPFTAEKTFIEWDKKHHNYVKRLQEIVKQLHECRLRTHDSEKPAEAEMTVSPGDWVYVKVHRRNIWTQAYQTGPYQVLQSTGRSVQVQKEKTTVWYHLSHCFKSPVDPTERTLKQIQIDIGTASVSQDDTGEEPSPEVADREGPDERSEPNLLGAPEGTDAEKG